MSVSSLSAAVVIVWFVARANWYKSMLIYAKYINMYMLTYVYKNLKSMFKTELWMFYSAHGQEHVGYETAIYHFPYKLRRAILVIKLYHINKILLYVTLAGHLTNSGLLPTLSIFYESCQAIIYHGDSFSWGHFTFIKQMVVHEKRSDVNIYVLKPT